MIKLEIKKLNDNAVVPSRATCGSAGYDLTACTDTEIIIDPQKSALIPTGISAALTSDTPSAIFIYARSGLSTKNGIALSNGVGVVDSDYRGEIMVALTNFSDIPFTVTNGMRIAQMVVAPVFTLEITVTDTLSETDRGIGGFGSTGI